MVDAQFLQKIHAVHVLQLNAQADIITMYKNRKENEKHGGPSQEVIILSMILFSLFVPMVSKMIILFFRENIEKYQMQSVNFYFCIDIL